MVVPQLVGTLFHDLC